MQPTDRETFDGLLAELFGALDKPLTDAKREGFWKGLAQMSLPEFGRCRDVLLAKLAEGEAPRTFGVADIWAAKRQLRAVSPVYIHQTTDQAIDAWTLYANRLLLNHISRRLAASPKAFGPIVYGGYSPEQRSATEVLVQYKNAWAQDMREAADSNNEVAVETQRTAWRDCMERADADIVARWAA